MLLEGKIERKLIYFAISCQFLSSNVSYYINYDSI